MPLRYLRWLGGFVTGDRGVSFRTGEPARAAFLARLPLSLGLGAAALALATALAAPLGFAAALRPGGAADRAGRALVILAQAIPAFWLGLVAIWPLAVEMRLLKLFSGGPATLALVCLLIALPPMAMMARAVRRELLARAAEPWFRTALAQGLSRRAALWSHCGRPGFHARVAALCAEIGGMIGATATLEALFGLPGVSQFVIASVPARDDGVLLAHVMTAAAAMAPSNLRLAALLRLIDPRARRGPPSSSPSCSRARAPRRGLAGVPRTPSTCWRATCRPRPGVSSAPTISAATSPRGCWRRAGARCASS